MSEYSYVSVIEPMDPSKTLRLTISTKHRISPNSLVTVDGFPHPFRVVTCSLMNQDEKAVVTAIAPFERVTGIYTRTWTSAEEEDDPNV